MGRRPTNERSRYLERAMTLNFDSVKYRPRCYIRSLRTQTSAC